MSVLPFRPATGLPSIDAARYSHACIFADGMPFDGRFGAVIQDGLHLPPGHYEVDVPPAPHHVLFHVLATRTTHGVARVAGRRMTPPRARRTGLLPAGADSQWRSTAGSRMVHLHLAPHFLEELAAENAMPGGLAPVPVRLDFREARLARLLRRLEPALQGRTPLDLLFREQVAVLCATGILRLGQPPPRIVAQPPRLGLPGLAALRAHVEERLDGTPDLAELAAVAGLPRAAFLRAFRAEQGESPARYLARRRVERAKPLLRDGRLTLAEVAARCGFADAPQMARHFRRLTGCPPARWRAGQA